MDGRRPVPSKIVGGARCGGAFELVDDVHNLLSRWLGDGGGESIIIGTVKSATLVLCVLLAACSQPAETPHPVAKTLPPDESRKFPVEHQVSMQLVPEHVLGKTFLPGGNLAEYRQGARVYRVFLIHAADAQKASFLLVDWRNALTKPQYLPNMGGFFGMDGGTPVYVFSKGPYVAGWVGLPQAEADRLARQFATHLQ